ncbi:hypothetical protein KAJ83_01160 [Marivibrio halodurans]|uniref:Uncharacterized protein n=1 Tax=Marivibrio halodurans TaxID=2039722 RepID=A0A8J7UZE7_9PROT|nr:hypothetical protein [Marivibrio halodurans]MBP5855601.1 hypothetical protein [Marivibrio halodurans]
MEIDRKNPPRRFTVGREGGITIADCAAIALSPDEQVTFTTPAGGEYDVARKAWGFYATPSLNGRLPAHGLRPALCVNAVGRLYLLLREDGREGAFEAYLEAEGMRVLVWLDDPEAATRLAASLG